MNTEPFAVLQNYGWLRTMDTEPFDVLRNYGWLSTMDTEPLDVLRNGKYVVGRQNFVDTTLRRRAFRRQVTLLIESEEAQMIITELYWSYRKINLV
jgi:hypothetical protein